MAKIRLPACARAYLARYWVEGPARNPNRWNSNKRWTDVEKVQSFYTKYGILKKLKTWGPAMPVESLQEFVEFLSSTLYQSLAAYIPT